MKFTVCQELPLYLSRWHLALCRCWWDHRLHEQAVSQVNSGRARTSKERVTMQQNIRPSDTVIIQDGATYGGLAASRGAQVPSYITGARPVHGQADRHAQGRPGSSAGGDQFLGCTLLSGCGIIRAWSGHTPQERGRGRDTVMILRSLENRETTEERSQTTPGRETKTPLKKPGASHRP